MTEEAYKGTIDGRPIYEDEGAKKLHKHFDIPNYHLLGETMANTGLKQAARKLIAYSKKAGAIVGIPLEDLANDIKKTLGHITVEGLVQQRHIRVETYDNVKVAYPTEKLLLEVEVKKQLKIPLKPKSQFIRRIYENKK